MFIMNFFYEYKMIKNVKICGLAVLPSTDELEMLTCLIYSTNNSWWDAQWDNSSVVASEGPEGSVSFWTGGMYSPVDRQWVWYHEGAPVQPGNQDFISAYQNWGPEQPAPFNGKNNCVILKVFRDQSFFWYNEECPRRNYYICKTPKRCV